MAKNIDTIPIEVCILTADHDIKGTVHVSKYTNTNRELTDLLNDRERRFLAVTNAEAVFKESGRSQEDIARFRELRLKLNQTKPF